MAGGARGKGWALCCAHVSGAVPPKPVPKTADETSKARFGYNLLQGQTNHGLAQNVPPQTGDPPPPPNKSSALRICQSQGRQSRSSAKDRRQNLRAAKLASRPTRGMQVVGLERDKGGEVFGNADNPFNRSEPK